ASLYLQPPSHHLPLHSFPTRRSSDLCSPHIANGDARYPTCLSLQRPRNSASLSCITTLTSISSLRSPVNGADGLCPREALSSNDCERIRLRVVSSAPDDPWSPAAHPDLVWPPQGGYWTPVPTS